MQRIGYRFGLSVIAASCLCGASFGYEIDPASPIAPALTKAQNSVEVIVSLPDATRTFDNTVGAVDDLLATLEKESSMTQFMAYVSTDAAERERGSKAEEDYANWKVELVQNEPLYKAVKAVAASKPKVTPEQQRLMDHLLREFRRGGMELTPEKRTELKKIQMEINKLAIEFDKNIREDETVVLLTRAELPGMPEDYFAILKQSGDLYLVNMSYPQFQPVMDWCDDETTRSKVWLEYKRRGGQKNVNVLEKVLKLRAQAAELLGYKTSADYETEVRMSKNAANVQAFYDELRPLVRPKAQSDFDELLALKRAHTGDQKAQLFPWDQPYYENRLKKEKYAVDARKVQEYFPMQSVVDGLFSITQSLYGLEYREITNEARSQGKPMWHEDVRLFEVWDKATNTRLGEFYIDLYPRENKYTHAAQWGLVQHKVWADGSIDRPVAALVCNFTKPTADKPSLLTHDEVETFFHEFGHCLHTILSESNYNWFAGTNVERDFVEAPSQMFENWVWNADVLKTFARHYQTGEPLPAELLDGMVRARNMGSGLFSEHQYYYGLVDMAYHTAPKGEVDTTQVGLDLFGEVELYQPVPQSRFQASFGHLMGYQAGYYGYQWSLVYACDMFQRFKELGMLDPKAGMYYRQKILAKGGTQDAMDLVRDYLGREPQMDAYLKNIGLNPKSKSN